MKANVPIKLVLWCKSEVTSPILVKFPWVYIGLTENRFSSLEFSWNFHMTSNIMRLIFKGASFSMLHVRFLLLVQPENTIVEKNHLWRRLAGLEKFHVNVYFYMCASPLTHLTLPFSWVQHTQFPSIGKHQTPPGFLFPVFISGKVHSISTKLWVLTFPTKYRACLSMLPRQYSWNESTTLF